MRSATLDGHRYCVEYARRRRENDPEESGGPMSEPLVAERRLAVVGAGPRGVMPVSYTHLTLPTILLV